MQKLLLTTLLAFGLTHTTAHANDDLSETNQLVCEVVSQTTKHALDLHHAGHTTDEIIYNLRDVNTKVLAELLTAETDDDVKVGQFITVSVAFARMPPIVANIGNLPANKTTKDKAFIKKTHAECLTKTKTLPDEIAFVLEAFELAEDK